jgi:hypothetical protein
MYYDGCLGSRKKILYEIVLNIYLQAKHGINIVPLCKGADQVN